MALATPTLGGYEVSDPGSWLDKYGRYLFHFALARLRNTEAAEDMVQETFLAGIKAQHAFCGRSTEKTWLVGILKHKIVDHIRKASRERMVMALQDLPEESEEFRSSPNPLSNLPQANAEGPRKALEKKEFFEALGQSLGEIPPRLAQAFVLREIEELKSEEICKTMEVNAANLWVMLHRARHRLRDRLDRRLAS